MFTNAKQPQARPRQSPNSGNPCMKFPTSTRVAPACPVNNPTTNLVTDPSTNLTKKIKNNNNEDHNNNGHHDFPATALCKLPDNSNEYLSRSQIPTSDTNKTHNDAPNRTHTNVKSVHHKTSSECIGFSTLPDQLHKRAVKRGFDFSFMVAGQSGLGKTTFLLSLFPKANWEMCRDESGMRTLQIQQQQLEVEERGVKLRLTLIDTPGFGNSFDSSNDIKAVEKHVKRQLQEFLKAEMGTRRQAMQDHRIHCCLYFLNPAFNRLRTLDLLAIKSLQDKVNLVPVIAKADSLTPSELQEAKTMVMHEIRTHGLRVYELPMVDADDGDDEYIAKDKELKNRYPFSVVCSDKVVEVGGKRVVGRVYPWGVVEVENKEHSDFKLLRYFLLNSHMHDLIENTKEVHYENFRAANLKKLQKMGSSVEKNDEQIDDLLKEKEVKLLEMQRKLEEMKTQLSKQHTQDNTKPPNNIKTNTNTNTTTTNNNNANNSTNNINIAPQQHRQNEISRSNQLLNQALTHAVPTKMPVHHTSPNNPSHHHNHPVNNNNNNTHNLNNNNINNSLNNPLNKQFQQQQKHKYRV